ncbi:hypothetical protein [Mariniblastus fucicola]|uniref:Uncharacterized protein n=1 Tax=Mariniblastus fucicola TaxID=980251 RepID=A0A5B9PBZ0_9BACT|nr:hypothetical protein [Mariniblastus fucicola]QEG22016.1 hypothetical protein MFFC18_18770 [Mariniblastus fucicola]
MKRLVIVAVVVAGVVAYSFAHPYLNGVAYVHQRECERAALLPISLEINELRYADNGTQLPTIRQIVENAPKPTDIDDSMFDVKMKWDIVDRQAFRLGDSDKTVLLYPDLTPIEITESLTPLIAHVSSSFTVKNNNCLLLVLPTAEVTTEYLTDRQFENLLQCNSPDEASAWLKSHLDRN